MAKSKTTDYWIKRAKERSLEDIRDTNEVVKLVDKQFKKSMKMIEKEMAMIFHRFTEDNELDYNLAIELLTGDEYKDFRMDLKEYIDLIEDPNILLELNTLSARSRITKLEASFLELQKHLDELYLYQHTQIEELMKATTEVNYYKTIFDMGIASSVPVKEFHKLTKAEIIKDFEKPWSGKNFSERLWTNRTKLKDALEEEIIQAAIQGTNTQLAAERLMKKLEVSKKVASRLIHTEQAYFSNLGSLKAYKELGTKEYIYIATLDLKTSDVCRDLDHEVFKVEDGQSGKNMPPMHPHCRSTTAPYTGELTGTRMARDKDNNSVRVDKNLSYHEWHNKYVKSDPEFLLEEKKWKNRHSDKKQFERYRKLNAKVPRKLDDFQEIKYNVPVRMNLQLLASKDLLKQTDKQIMKGIKSNVKQIEKHKEKVLNPHLFDPEFNTYTDKHKEGLVRHWKKEIKTFEKNIGDSIEELEKRGVDVSEWKNKQ